MSTNNPEIWVDDSRKSPDKTPDPTTDQCVELVSRLIDREVFTYRNLSHLKTQDEIIQMGMVKDRVVRLLRKHEI